MKTTTYFLIGLLGLFELTVTSCGRDASASDGDSDTDTDTDTDTDADADSDNESILLWISIPGGTFQMGSKNGENHEQPVHTVTVPPFKISKTEVTIAEYGQCVTAGECSEPQTGNRCNWNDSGYENHPVNCVTWYQGVTFCAWAGGRLPSESEWEYAARNGSAENLYPWGNVEATCDYAVMDDDAYSNGCDMDRTWAVCSKTLGNSGQAVCDMAGNVSEWVQDTFHHSYADAPSDGSTWEYGGSGRVVRDGGYYGHADDLLAFRRGGTSEIDQYHTMGFRCASSDADSDTDTDTDTDSDSDGYWYDEITDLYWVDPSPSFSMTWYQALDYCDNLLWVGFDDWRLPNVEEAISLIRGCQDGTDTYDLSLSLCTMMPDDCVENDDCNSDIECNKCGIWNGPGVFGYYWPPELWDGTQYWDNTSDVIWTSSARSGMSELAWDVLFRYGTVAVFPKGILHDARCVRGGSDGDTDTDTDVDTDTSIDTDIETSLTWTSISGGTFEMGSTTGEFHEQPVHTVTVPSFEMTETEVTVAQYRECVTTGTCTDPDVGNRCNWNDAGYENHPVNCLDYYQAIAFCTWAGGRLPNESEWEYAASNGNTENIYPWGDETATCDYAVMDDGGDGCGTNRTWPVCSKVAGNTASGLCDMAGNVWEWVQDVYHGSYDCYVNKWEYNCLGFGLAPTDGSAWMEGEEFVGRVRRGGAFFDNANKLRAAFRYDYDEVVGHAGIGFRCAR